jgi:hypothetical protein
LARTRFPEREILSSASSKIAHFSRSVNSVRPVRSRTPAFGLRSGEEIDAITPEPGGDYALADISTQPETHRSRVAARDLSNGNYLALTQPALSTPSGRSLRVSMTRHRRQGRSSPPSSSDAQRASSGLPRRPCVRRRRSSTFGGKDKLGSGRRAGGQGRP